MKTLDELHKAYMQDKEHDEDYNYDNDNTESKDNEFTVLDMMKLMQRSR